VNRIPERNRPLVILATGVVVLLLVAAGVLFLGQLGPSPTPTMSLPPSATASPSAGASTPEGATRAFFDAFARARRTDDPTIVLPFTTGESSDAYRSAEAFLRGQRESGKASIITQLDISNVSVDVQGDRATVRFDYVQGGYDIDLDTGKPLESPVTLPLERVTAVAVQRGQVWLVESYVSQ
jgi:ABC-type phosphate transport system substrate-binding protein